MKNKKENPLRQLPLDMRKCGEIKIHLDELIEKEGYLLISFLSVQKCKDPNCETTGTIRYNDWTLTS